MPIVRFACFFALIALLALMYAPTALTLLSSLEGGQRGFDRQVGYFNFLQDRVFAEAISNSFISAALAAALGVLVSAIALYFDARIEKRKMVGALTLLLLPFFAGGVVTGIVATAVAREVFHISPSMPLGVLLLACASLPLCGIVLFLFLHGADLRVERIAQTLGAAPSSVAWRVTLPLLWPGLFGAFLTAFLYSFNNLDVVQYSFGIDGSIPSLIWGQMRHGFDPSVLRMSTTLSLLFLSFSFLSFLGMSMILRRRAVMARRAR